jgi:hypothetical protein
VSVPYSQSIPLSHRAEARTSVRARRLEVPIGGHGWGSALLARFTVVFSLHTISWVAPFQVQSLGIFRYNDLGAIALSQSLPIFPDRDANMRFYQHFVPLVVALIWLLLDRKRKHEVLIHEVGRLMARYSIAAILAMYGFEKTFGAQGSSTYITNSRLLQPFGDQTRQFTVFTWLGHSIIYENFAALVELSPLMLIPFRRTATIGAMLALAACVNVFIVNTGHWNNGLSLTPIGMIALPIVLLIPYGKRFTQFFLGKPAEPMVLGYLTPPGWWWRVAAVTKAVVVPWGFVAANHFYFAAGPHAWMSTLGGLYRVESFERNGRTEFLGAEYPNRWREVAIGRYGGDVTIATVDGTMMNLYVQITPDPNDKTMGSGGADWARRTSERTGELPISGVDLGGLEREKKFDFTRKGSLRWVHEKPDEVRLSGVVLGDTVVARLTRVPTDTMPIYRYRWYPEEWRRRFATWMRAHGVVYPY